MKWNEKCLRVINELKLLKGKELDVYTYINKHYHYKYNGGRISYFDMTKDLRIDNSRLNEIIFKLKEKGLIVEAISNNEDIYNLYFYLTLPTTITTSYFFNKIY